MLAHKVVLQHKSEARPNQLRTTDLNKPINEGSETGWRVRRKELITSSSVASLVVFALQNIEPRFLVQRVSGIWTEPW